MPAPMRLILTGPPASGKTFVAGIVTAWLTKAGIEHEVVTVDDALRVLYPPTTVSDEYSYDDAGALSLHRREEQIPRALRHAIQACRATIDEGRSLVLELAGNECPQLIEEAPDILAGSSVIALSADEDVRCRRNSERGAARIPDAHLRDYPDHLPAEWIQAFEQAGARVSPLDGGRSQDDVRRMTIACLDRLPGN